MEKEVLKFVELEEANMEALLQFEVVVVEKV